MRGLAQRLGTYPNVVYWHLGNRERVLALAVDLALSEMNLAEATTPWPDWLAATARELRRVVHAHPAIAPLLASRLLVSPPTLPSVESVLACLDRAGFAAEDLAAAYNAYVGSVIGWVCVEVAAPADAPSPWQEEFRAAITGLDPAAFPTIAANRAALADQAVGLRWHGGRDRPLDAAFEMAIEVWLTGLDQSPRRRRDLS